MPPREVNNTRVESALWEACLKLRNDELGKKLYNFMKRTWLAALSDLKKNAEAPRRDEERREHFAKAFISDTLWRLYQSAESGTLDISEEDANKMFNDVFGRPNIFPEEAGGHLSPPPRRWELIADVVKDTYLEVTDAKVKDSSTGPKPKKRKPSTRKPPGSGPGSGKPYSSWAKKNAEAASSQEMPFWYRKYIGMDHKDKDAQSSRPPPPPRWHRSPEGSEGRWEGGGDWRWKSAASSTRSVISTPVGRARSRSRSPRGPMGMSRQPPRAPGWRKSSRSRGRRRRGGQRHRGGGGKRGNSRRRDAPPRSGRRRSEARKSRGRRPPGDRSEGIEAAPKSRAPASKSPMKAASASVKSPKPSEASKPPKASDSSECSTPRAAKSKASKASKATKESQAEEAQEEAKSRESTSMEESEDEKSQAKAVKVKEEQEEDGSASGGIRLTEAKDVVRENENEDKDIFDELDDVGLMAHLQGTLKVSAVDNESVEDGAVGVSPVEDTELQDDTADTEIRGGLTEPCVNLSKGICLNKEAPECKTRSFEGEDRGGVFRGVFCHSCSEILERGWALVN